MRSSAYNPFAFFLIVGYLAGMDPPKIVVASELMDAQDSSLCGGLKQTFEY